MNHIKKIKLGECSTIIPGVLSQEKKKKKMYCYTAIQPGQLTQKGLEDGYGTVYRENPCTEELFLQQGDVLVKRLNPDCAVVFAGTEAPVVSSANIFVIRPGESLVPEYLAFILEESNFLQRISQLSGIGTTVAALTGSQIADGVIPLPALTQQRKLGYFWKLSKKEKYLLNSLLIENDKQMRALCGKLYQ